MALPAMPRLWKKFVLTIWNPTIQKDMVVIRRHSTAASIWAASCMNMPAMAAGKRCAMMAPSVVTTSPAEAARKRVRKSRWNLPAP